MAAHRVSCERVQRGYPHSEVMKNPIESQRPGAYCRALCKSVSGGRRFCTERLKHLHWKAGVDVQGQSED